MPNDIGRASDVELGTRESPRSKRSDQSTNTNKPSKKSQVASEQSMQPPPKEPWKITIRINDCKFYNIIFTFIVITILFNYNF